MKRKIINVVAVVLMVVMAVVMGMSVKQSIDWQAKYNEEHEQLNEAQHVIGHYEAQEAMRVFDTQAIERWCGGAGLDGKVRMIGAEVVGREGTLITVEDEQGQQWLMDNVAIEDTDNVLLWIADNNTALDYTDDAIIKVFVEVYK